MTSPSADDELPQEREPAQEAPRAEDDAAEQRPRQQVYPGSGRTNTPSGGAPSPFDAPSANPAPGGWSGHTGGTTDRRGMPPTVKWAVRGMYLGAAFEVVSLIMVLLDTTGIHTYLRQHGESASLASSSTHLFIAAAVFGAIVGAGLWIWMALANRAGLHWARVLSTVFYGLDLLIGFADLGSVGAGIASAGYLVNIALGASIIVLLWHRVSTPYYRR